MRKSAILTGMLSLASVLGVAFIGVAAPDGAERTYKPMLPPANFSPPAIEVDEANFDWGSALQGEKVRHDYVIKNTGGSPLVISQVKASCGCTTARKPTKPIPPGKTDFVTLEIDTKRFSGKVKKGASVYSNALPSPLQITIGGAVDALYKQDPPNPRLQVVRGMPAEPVTVTLSKSPTANVGFRVLEAATESQILQAQVAEVKPGELYEITLGADVGTNNRKYFYEKLSLKLEVDGKGSIDHDINVSISVKERINVKPRTSVYFSRNDTKLLVNGGQAISKTLDIESLGGPEHSFQIKKITTAPVTRSSSASASQPAVPSESSYFDTKVETVTPGRHYRLTVVMSKVPQGGVRTLRERLLVETDDPTVKTLTITAMAAVY